MKPTATPGFTAYARDLAEIAGRFTLVAKSDESVVVGLIGKCRYADLNETQLRHIAEFYGAMPSPPRIPHLVPRRTKRVHVHRLHPV